MSDAALLMRRLERERRARKEAEALLESKSLELYRAHEALKSSHDAIGAAKAYTENILRSIINALLVVTPDGIIQAVNTTACALLGYDESALIGQPMTAILLPTMPPAPVRSQGSQTCSRMECCAMSRRCMWPETGGRIPVLFSGSVMRDDAGTVQGIVCVAQDITERKQAEELRSPKRGCGRGQPGQKCLSRQHEP